MLKQREQAIALLQRHAELRQLNSQAAGLTHLLMDDAEGRFRDATIDYLLLVNGGRDTAESLAALSGQAPEAFDARYPEFLQVSDDDLRFLQIGVPLRNLSLGRTTVTDQGLARLAEANLTQLAWLDLAFTRTTDVGLASAKEATAIKQLNLEATAISDASLDVIARFRSLEELDLSATRVSDAGLARLEPLGAPLSYASPFHFCSRDRQLDHSTTTLSL